MKLKPRQVIGLAAIVVFGGIMVMTLTRPSEREVMEQRLASAPLISAPTELPALPPVTLPSLTAPTPATGGNCSASTPGPRGRLLHGSS